MSEDRLWVEKHRPASLDALEYNTNLKTLLNRVVTCDDFPHLLLYGPSGAGKRTLTRCILQKLFGPGVQKIKSEIKEFKATSSTSTECVIFSSNFHIELTPSEADNYDRVIVNKMIKEVASSYQIDTKKQHPFKVVVIHEVDNLTKEAQAGLRRTMEKYINTCRIIFNCESVSKVIQPIRSRCLLVRVPAPSAKDIAHVLKGISQREGFALPDKLATKIGHVSGRNLRRAIMMM